LLLIVAKAKLPYPITHHALLFTQNPGVAMSPASPPTFIRLAPEDIAETLHGILKKVGFPEDKASVLAQTFMENSLDGVYTHGLNRFARFIELVRSGHVNMTGEATLKSASGAMEQWDGNLAAGITNGLLATNRAMELARAHGLGCVGLANTNHWMRGGTYGWRAATQGFIFIGWTNTIANMPAWGALDSRLGNNPLVLAVPHEDQAIVLDMAMSQFSYGAMEARQLSGEQLPVPGGYDAEGALSRDPAAILDTQRALPVGYWKGAGLSLLLDILATVISGGLSTAEISGQGDEYGVSQVFIALDTRKLGEASTLRQTVSAIVEDYRQSQPIPDPTDGKSDIHYPGVHYPGESALSHREANRRDGIPVEEPVWAGILTL
jgi:3-dehydro-L-gulonate 2-dehydrogenase